MCSLNDGGIFEEFVCDKKITSQNCKKCHSVNTSIVLRKNDVYCKSCFLAASTHKFRAMLGKYRIIQPNEKVLVIYGLGHPSASLLHFIRTGLDLSQHKRFRFDPVFLFIDEYQDLTLEERIDILTQVYDQISTFKFVTYFTCLQTYIENNSQTLLYYEFKEYICNIEGNGQFKQRKDLTKQQDINEMYKRNLIVNIAKKLDCTVALIPDISFDTAVGILNNISLGRGAHLPLNVGVLDDRDSDVKIFTPLRLFEMKELAYYNHFNNIKSINIIPVQNSSYTSIQKLMKKFVEDLQINYPSTIKTVTRTGDKLTCPKTNTSCILCKAPIEKLDELSSMEATEFSQYVSTKQLVNIEIFRSTINNIHEYCFACNKIKNILKENSIS